MKTAKGAAANVSDVPERSGATRRGPVAYVLRGVATTLAVLIAGHVAFQISALFMDRGPLAPPRWPDALLGWLMAPGDVIRQTIPPLDAFLLVPLVDFYGWAIIGAVGGLVYWLMATGVRAITDAR